MSIRTAIFDFDGTLFDSMGIWETAGEDYLASLGRRAEPNLWDTLKTMSMLQSARYLKARYDLPQTVEEIMAGVNKTVEDFYFYRAMPKEHVISFLSALQSRGVRMCVATATDRYQVEAALRRCDMLRFFERIFTCSEVGHGKDEPQIFEYACHAAKTAKGAGFFVVGVYDRYEKRTEEVKALTDVYVSGFGETEKLLAI